MENNLMQDILYEFEKSNNQTSDLFRLQSDLSHAESELIALQVRFVHKQKENNELRIQLEHKTHQFNEIKSEYECKLERFESFEYHYNELVNKHKLCLECMNQQRLDNEILKEKYEFLNSELSKMDQDKVQLQDLFKDQIEDLDLNLKRLIKENEDNIKIIKDLTQKASLKEKELEESKEINFNLQDIIKQLEHEKLEYSNNIGEKCKQLNLNEDSIKMLELELARCNSKLDQTNFELNDIKTNYLNQTKIVRIINCYRNKHFNILNKILDGYFAAND